MNEELKIIITAATSEAQKNIKDVSKEIKGLEKQGNTSGGNFSSAMAAMGKGAATALAATAAAVAAVGAALIGVEKSTRKYREEQARLVSAFQATGSTAEQASETYKNLYRFLGESDRAAEAAGHLAQLSSNQQDLAEWTKAAQGIYATFGESLPIESLTEAANETANVGVVTGTLADALTWAGISEDAFNASLAQCNTTAEREKLIRETLNGLYSDAAELYEINNKAIIEQNEAQANLTATLAQIGTAVTPLTTALTNLANALLSILAPAINAIIPILVSFVNAISQAVQWVMNFFGIVSGGGAKASVTVNQISKGVGSAANNAKALTNGYKSATAAAEKLKRTTLGFDELTKVGSTSTPSAGAGAGGAGGGSGAGVGGIGPISGGGIQVQSIVEENAGDSFFEKMKVKIGEIKAELAEMFAPSITAWQGAWTTIAESWTVAKDNFLNGILSIWDGFSLVGTYVVEQFVPNIVNSFSENLAPLFGDVFGAAIIEISKNFEFVGSLFERVCADMINPALESIQMVATDVFEGIGAAWDKHGSGLLEQISIFWDGVREGINTFYEKVILPVWKKLKAVFDKVWKEGLEPLVDEFMDAALVIGTELLALYNSVIKPVADWILAKIYPIIVDVINKTIEKVGGILITISQVIEGAIKVIKGIVQFISGVFTGDWKKAWTGVQNIFKGIWDALYALIKVPLNSIIGGINTVIKGITSVINTAIKAINKISVKVPDWVPEIGGKKFGFNIKEMSAPTIPKLAEGGIAIDSVLANIGERGKEAVLPLESNTEWMDKLADRLSARTNTPSKIVLMLDSKELGWANINSINNITKQTGQLQLALV